ncbi:MAG: hypothetical protein ACYSWZ_11180 [Planctomycetota bacterium]
MKPSVAMRIVFRPLCSSNGPYVAQSKSLGMNPPVTPPSTSPGMSAAFTFMRQGRFCPEQYRKWT